MIVRPEQPADVAGIRVVHDAAFRGTAEGRLVDALRDAGRLTLSLVAEMDAAIVGHVGFSPVTPSGSAKAFGLAPLGVWPDVQRRGMGAALVSQGLRAVQLLDADFVVVLGDPRYYGRFGFAPAGPRGLLDEFRGGDAFQVIEFRAGSVERNPGLVRYAPEFALVA